MSVLRWTSKTRASLSHVEKSVCVHSASQTREFSPEDSSRGISDANADGRDE